MTAQQAHQAAAEALMAARKPSKSRQCSSVFATRSGASFCVKREGHDGDHRGYRAQWTDQGRVKITEPLSR